MDLSQLIPANRPGLAVAQWQIDSGTDELILEIFQVVPIESGLLDAIVFYLPLNSMSIMAATTPGKASE